MFMTMSEWIAERRLLGDSLNQLESDGNSGLLAMSNKYMVGGMYIYTSPRYYIWIDGVLVKITSIYSEAYEVWNGLKKQQFYRSVGG